METPLSTRRITRSLAAPSAQKSAAAHFSRAKNPAALHDITNDSPIVGLHDKTPASTAAKNRRRAGAAPRRTPGSGEALLRGQVKALLHKLQEEEQGCAAAAIVRPACIQALLGVSRSPAQLLSPTPANTPQIGPVSAVREGLLMPDGSTLMPCVLENEESLLPKLQVIAASLPVPPPEDNLGECQLNHALVFDESPGKSDASNGSAVSSSLSLQDSISGSYMDKSSSPEDDSSSAWSIQVHASSEKGDEEDLAVEELGEHTEEDEEELGEHTEEEEERWEDSDDDCFDDLCEDMSRMTVFDDEENAGLPQFEGWHTRFIYNSDDEIEREEVVDAAEARAELGALVLRGLPVPEGRHLRFNEEDEE
ncbi:uncharacterized protein LOC133907003 [Phragmites australis]|uniref:uncharacterized protein LOC133907003 n=1 Tax=Phragmites australis TaxID=29695 RepID=UPI002D775A67|nr:uncharacterized protein LOC133907003 [Phragmites australis]